MNCFGLRSNVTSAPCNPDHMAARPHNTPSDTVSVSDASGSAATGMPKPFAVGLGAWKNLGNQSPGLKGGGADDARNEEACELDEEGPPLAPAAPAAPAMVPPAANPTLLQQIANLPTGAKATVASLTLASVAGMAVFGYGVSRMAHPPAPDTHPNPTPAEPPFDPMVDVLYNATQAAVARCFGNNTAMDPDHHFDVMPSITGTVYNQGVAPLMQAGVANITQAIQQLNCPTSGADEGMYRRLGDIMRSLVQQLGELAPHLPAPVPAPIPAPHTGASARVAADVVGTMALTVALHTLGLF